MAVGVILAAAAAQASLRLADALAAAHALDEVLGDSLVEALPVLLGDEDPGEHDAGGVGRGEGEGERETRRQWFGLFVCFRKSLH